MKNLARILRRVRSLPAAAALALSAVAFAQAPQEHVHQHGGDVMPFDLAQTVHVFRMTEDGGVQKVVTRGDAADPQQAMLIQHHLMMEAQRFQKGDFTDPSRLHGSTMPGLR
ncbi:MAG TPA: aspartate carbamoyltransferase, partial [Ramlibacter sp.]